MRALIALAFVAIGLNIAAGFADASCIQESLAERAQRADLIAYGRLNGDRLEIRQVLKGDASGIIQVRLRPEKGVVTSVDYMPADNTDQTLYLRVEGSEYVTDACSGSHAGVPTAEERTFFGVGEAPMTSGDDAVRGDDAFASGQAITVALAALGLGALAAFVVLRGRRKATV